MIARDSPPGIDGAWRCVCRDEHEDRGGGVLRAGFSAERPFFFPSMPYVCVMRGRAASCYGVCTFVVVLPVDTRRTVISVIVFPCLFFFTFETFQEEHQLWSVQDG